MCLKLRDQQIKIITYIESATEKLMLPINQRSNRDTHTKKSNRTLKIVTKSQEKRIKETEKLQNNPQIVNKIAEST